MPTNDWENCEEAEVRRLEDKIAAGDLADVPPDYLNYRNRLISWGKRNGIQDAEGMEAIRPHGPEVRAARAKARADARQRGRLRARPEGPAAEGRPAPRVPAQRAATVATRGPLPTVVGYACVYRTTMWARCFPGQEKVLWELKGPPATATRLALHEHDRNREIAGNIRLLNDGVGLIAVLKPDDTAQGRALIEAIRSGDYAGMSVERQDVKLHFEPRGGQLCRVVTDWHCTEITFTPRPACRDTCCALADELRNRQHLGDGKRAGLLARLQHMLRIWDLAGDFSGPAHMEL